MVKKKILIVSGDPDDGLVHQRIHLPFVHLKDEYEFTFKSCSNVCHIDFWYKDAVIFVHPSNKRNLDIILTCRAHYKLPIIIDLDDALDAVPENHPYYYLFETNYVREIVKYASHCVFATEYLKQHFADTNSNSTVIENTINLKSYRFLQHKRPAKFTIGWAGSETHRPDLEVFSQSVHKFMDKHKDVMYFGHVLCPQVLISSFKDRVTYVTAPVHFLDYPKAVSEYPVDVMLVGLTNNTFNDAKSDLKLLEMSPFKIPIIASPRADFLKHKDILTIAENGESEHLSWFEALELAYTNYSVLKEKADQAYYYVMNHRTSDKAAVKWRQVIDNVTGVTK